MLPACHTLLQLAMLMAMPRPVDGWAAHPEKIILTAHIPDCGITASLGGALGKAATPLPGVPPQAHSLRTGDTFV